jgi:hypothetical protein
VLLGGAGQAEVADGGEAGRRDAVLQRLEKGMEGGAAGGRPSAAPAGPKEAE